MARQRTPLRWGVPRWGGLLVAAGLLLALTGCTGIQRSELAKRAKTEMVGMNREAILDCAGPPERVIRTGEKELLVYFIGDERVSARRLAPLGLGGPMGFSGADETNCEVSFVLVEGRVSEVRYRGGTGGLFSRAANCASILRYCVK
jgi:hypothetical protein